MKRFRFTREVLEEIILVAQNEGLAFEKATEANDLDWSIVQGDDHIVLEDIEDLDTD